MFSSRHIWTIIDRAGSLSLLAATIVLLVRLTPVTYRDIRTRLVATTATSPAERPADSGGSNEGTSAEAIHSVDLTINAHSLRDAATLGLARATLAIVEFSDYQCPFCARFAQTSFLDVQRALVDNGRAKYVVFNFPLERIHPHARETAEVAECVGAQGRFWPFRKAVFTHQQNLDLADLKTYARAVNVDEAVLNRCLQSHEMTDKVDRHMALAARMGVSVTPTFLVGAVQRDGTIHATRRLEGAQSLATIRTAVSEIGTD